MRNEYNQRVGEKEGFSGLWLITDCRGSKEREVHRRLFILKMIVGAMAANGKFNDKWQVYCTAIRMIEKSETGKIEF